MAKSFKYQRFPIAKDDPLAATHQDIAAWIEESTASLGKHNWYQDVDLKSLPSGRKLAEAAPPQARIYVMAALAQVRHWDQEVERVRDQAEDDSDRLNAHFLPGWEDTWGRRRKAESVMSTLMRKNLPFERCDLIALLNWCNELGHPSKVTQPLGAIVRALQRFAKSSPLEQDLENAARHFAALLRGAYEKDVKRLATDVEQLCPSCETTEIDGPARPAPQPGPAGHDEVLTQLKRQLGMLSADSDAPSTPIGPDHFPLSDRSPLKTEHQLLTKLLDEMVAHRHGYTTKITQLKQGKKLLALAPQESCKLLLAAAERHVFDLSSPDTYFYPIAVAIGGLAESQGCLADCTRENAFDFLLYLAFCPDHLQLGYEGGTELLIDAVERFAQESPLTEGERYVIWLLRGSLISGPLFGSAPPTVARLTKLVGDQAMFCLAPGEVWSDAVNADFMAFPAQQRQDWAALFAHAATATASRPSQKWLTTAKKLVAELGVAPVQHALERWLPLVTQGRSVMKLGSWSGDIRGSANTMIDENANCLRGLLWLIPTLSCANQLARLIGGVALTAYKKVPGVGPRAVKVGNAAVYALSELHSPEAIGQLAMLKVRVKFGTAQKEVEKAFNTAAEALGLPRDQIEELGVPSYGLETGGVRRESYGDYRAELLVSGSGAELTWRDGKGKPLKSVPAKVKQEHAEDLRELQQSLKDIRSMLPAQRDRIDSLFLLQKSWPITDWRERYLEHPLLGTIASRLIWNVNGTPALFLDGAAVDLDGEKIKDDDPTAEVALWHPVGRPVDEIVAWRDRLEQHGIVQPFKQAHREIYLLTDAERNTQTYSNRYAAHVIRQHQFNALCAARGWKNRLRLMVDDSYEPPTKDLPQWGLRAEYWVEGIGDDYGSDTNESGVYLRLATDQVRFYRTGAAANWAHAGGGGYTMSAYGPGERNLNEALPLDQIPPLVFSEVMRDVDLFVGVASIGNDPSWQDGGAEGRYQTYWHNYSFGELSGTATTRKQVLERLTPRLKIADRCSFTDRFLIVRGQIRTYKIHLGSGNILMEPNDQYLCIVPDSKSRSKPDDLFLPFEGDATLSIILSKALLLAADDKIKDPTITRQIEGK